MGRPSGVTHSTVRPDCAMSLALSVSQFLGKGKERRKWLKLVHAAVYGPHSLPAQVQIPARLSVALMGSLVHQ